MEKRKGEGRKLKENNEKKMGRGKGGKEWKKRKKKGEKGKRRKGSEDRGRNERKEKKKKREGKERGRNKIITDFPLPSDFSFVSNCLLFHSLVSITFFSH